MMQRNRHLRQPGQPLLGALLVLTLGASGCVSKQVDRPDFPELTMQEAREIQNTQLQEFVDLVPKDQVIEVSGPIPKMSGMSCDGDISGKVWPWDEETGSYMLPGSALLRVQQTLDVPQFLKDVAAQYEAKNWTIQERNKIQYSVDLYEPNGFVYTLTFIPQTESGRQSIIFDSFSPCFIPESDFTLFDEY